MQLTNRQCWDVIRALVKDKNEEYRKFLSIVFGDSEQVRKLLGFTRDSFLSKMGFYTIEHFNLYLKEKGNEPKSSWLDNLSCEDLLIFLDFRCRTLQQMYDYRLKYKTLNRNNVRDFIESAQISKLIGFNSGKLKCSGKPKRNRGEQNVFEMGVSINEINEQALVQIMANLAMQYSIVQNVSIDTAIEMAKKLVTSNFNLKGYETGYSYKGKISIKSQLSQEFKSKEGDNINIVTRGKFVGVDIQGSPIFEQDGKYYDALGGVLGDDVEIFTINDDGLLGL